jgi:hypothetical protein
MVQEKTQADDLSVEELTGEALRLMQIGLDNLYVVLGCQRMGSMRPSRIAAWVHYQAALKEILETQKQSPGSELQQGFLLVADELKREGIRFLESVSKELREVFDNDDLLRCTDEITPSTMQIIVVMTGAALRMPSQLEATSATVAAILCTLGLKKFCARE